MPSPVHRDSMSRADDGMSVFSTIRNHGAPQQIPRHSQDKFLVEEANGESVQARLNREMVSRVGNMGRLLPHETFVAAAQVGKYIVLAAMLPPYLLLYGIPKWTFTVMMPQAFQLGKEQFVKVGKFLQEWSNTVVDVMKGIIDQTLGEALRMFQQQGRRLWDLASRAAMVPVNALKDLANRVKEALSGPYQVVKGAADDVSQYFAEKLRKLKEAGQEFASAAGRVAEKMLSPLEALKEGWQRLHEGAAGMFNKISENVKPFALWMMAPMKNGMNNALTIGSRWLSLIADRGDALKRLFDITAIKDGAEAISKKVMDKVNEMTARIKEVYVHATQRAHEMFQQASQVAMKTVTAIPQAAFQACYWGFRLLPARRQQQAMYLYKQGRRFGGFLQGLYFGTKNGIKSLSHYAVEAYATFKSEVNKWVSWMIEKMKQLYAFILSLPGRIYRFLKAAYPVAKYVVTQMIYAVRLFVALLWAVIIVGLSSLLAMLSRYTTKSSATP